MASTSQFVSGVLAGVGLSLLLLLVSTLFPSPSSPSSPIPSSLQSYLLLCLTSSPLLSSSLLLPLLFLLLYSLLLPHLHPYRLHIPLSWASKTRHSKRNQHNLPPPYPNAFYRTHTAAALPPGAVRPITLLATDLVLYRPTTLRSPPSSSPSPSPSPSSSTLPPPAALDAYCPHLGAHLGYGGKVVGGDIECPFHGWRFNTDGRCTSIPYADKVPDIARTGRWEVREVDGGVWVWWDVDRRGVAEAGVEEPVDSLRAVGTDVRLVGEMEAEVGGHLREVWEGLLDGGDVDAACWWGALRVVKKRVGATRSLLDGVVMRLTVSRMGVELYSTYMHYTLRSPTHCHISLSPSPSPHYPPLPPPSLFVSITPQSPFLHAVHVSMYARRSWSLLQPLMERLLLQVVVMAMREEVVRVNAKGEGGLEGRFKGVEGGEEDVALKQFRDWFGRHYSAQGTRKRDGVEW